MDDAFDTEEAEEELVEQVLAELQIKQTGDLMNAPVGGIGQREQEKAPMKKEPLPEGGGECLYGVVEHFDSLSVFHYV